MIHIENLHKFYGSKENRIEVLKGLDLDIKEGKLVCLLGPSGSGKSTLLNILGGIELIDEGEVLVNSHNLGKMNKRELSLYRRNNLGFVFQFYNLVNNITVKENIEVGAYLSKSPLDVAGVLESLGLTEHRNKYPSQISGGQAQRTSIGRAIVKNPSLLICDEPTGALDYDSAKDVLNLIEELKLKYRPTIIIATHNTQIAKMCDVTIKLHNGRIKEVVDNLNPIAASEVVW